MMASMTCCESARARGLRRCGSCRAWIGGGPTAGRTKTRTSANDRFDASYVIQPVTKCWLWTKSKRAGYGALWIPGDAPGSGGHVGAHVFAYERFIGPVPEGLDVDHRCRNRACVNPKHLEAITRHANLHRSPHTQATKNSAKTQCIRGHVLEGDNLVVRRGREGKRTCRECERIHRRENARAARKRA